VRDLVRQNLRFFLWAALAALALRLTFFFWIPRVTDDSRFYADLAKNWLQHGTYGISDGNHVEPTFSRLPGYPAFLALVFALAGVDNYKAVLLLQIAVDLATCFLVADLARRCISARAAKAAFLLCAICPFLANFASAALTETLEIFFTVLALDFAIAALEANSGKEALRWAGCGLSIGACTLLRPDGGILLAVIGAYLGFLLVRALLSGQPFLRFLQAGLLVAALALAPLGLWGWRNWRTMHRIEFLAPRYANQDDEFVPMGFNRWVRTWIADYVSTEEIYWNVPGESVDPEKLPDRAFDSQEQRDKTLAAIAAYNTDNRITPDIDAQFGDLAAARISAHPLRYYLYLPALKIIDMWFRPRTELLPPDSRWYEFTDDLRWKVLALSLGLINLFYVIAAAAGLTLRWRRIAWVGLPVLFLVLRSLFLGTLENPESRYTLECYPVVILLAAALCAGADSKSDEHPLPSKNPN
jgi:4-amino-4-deoxy-L-arabinose transferase-like glycosyltransferase